MDKTISRKLLKAYSSFLKKESGKINVTDLCEKAGVARATFYVYYSDMESFCKSLNEYIIDKFFKQATLILSCDESEFSKTVKKENLLFDDDELVILGNMIKGTKFIDFAFLADSYYGDKSNDVLYSKEMWERYKTEIDIFSRGYLHILVNGINNYNEEAFRKDMKYCRLFFNRFYEYMKREM